jgi:23S rRNA pseudouridine2605 synthase
MRIQRAIARAGLASRRNADVLVAAGRVTVNGSRAVTGQTVDPSVDEIRVDGRSLPRATQVRWIVLNKPVGVVTTRRDPAKRPTVFELVPDIPGLTYVGRLDYLTAGVLLMTNDGAGAHRLAHPSGEVARTYVATVRGDAPAARDQMRRGVRLDDGIVRAEAVTVRSIPPRRWELELTLREGRNREVRRLCEAVGLQVESLVRTAYGSLELGTLEPGEWRELTKAEIRRLLRP